MKLQSVRQYDGESYLHQWLEILQEALSPKMRPHHTTPHYIRGSHTVQYTAPHYTTSH